MTTAGYATQCAGVRLYVEERGSGPKIVLLHGFTGSGESMRPVAEALAGWHCISVDLVGHGQSEVPEQRDAYRMDACVRQLREVIDVVSPGERPHLLGYSLGGRVALALAADLPGRFASLVLIGASAGLSDPGERQQRIRADEALADRIQGVGLEAFVDAWMALPLFSSQQRLGSAALARARAQRLRNDPKGLALSLRGMGSGAQPPLHTVLAGLDVPTLLVVGDEDEKFRRIAETLERVLPNARTAVLPDAGHAAHLENPAAFAECVRAFLDANAAILSPETSRTREDGKLSTSTSIPTGASKHMSEDWKSLRDYEDIRYERTEDGVARITICRPEVRNAFRPKTVFELIDAFARVREEPKVGVVLLTGEGDRAFCSGGDQKVRGDSGYVGEDGVPRLNILDVQRQIRSLPKPVIALVAGYAIGGGHVLHVCCDMTIAAENARFGQTGPKVGSFDGGFGASYLARIVGQKKAREIWYLCRQYDAREAEAMGLVNTVVPTEELQATGLSWAREILQHSPIAIRMLKSSFNAELDGQAGIQELAGNATMLYYMSEEAQEGRNAYVEKREPDFSRFPWRP